MRYIFLFTVIIFLIPVKTICQDKNGNEIKVTISKEKSTINGIRYYIHHVKKGENLFRISLAYKVKKEVILSLNPEIESENIKDGQILKIPVNQEDNTTQSANNNIQYKEYKVKRHDTEYSIANKFSITQEELNFANPQLDPQDLKTGQILKIPYGKYPDDVKTSVIVKDTVKESPAKQPDNIDSYCGKNNTYRIAILVPFFLDVNQSYKKIDTLSDSSESDKKYDEAQDYYKLTLNFVEFYQGALLAIDSLKKCGLKVIIYTYDAGRDTIAINKILDKPEMKNMDLIIGPFYSDAVQQVSRFSLVNEIKMISPVKNNYSILQNNPYLFEVIPGYNEYVDYMVNYITTIPNKNIIFINSNNSNDKEISVLFKSKLDQLYYNNYKIFNYNDDPTAINLLMSNQKTNIIILPTEDEGIASNILRMLDLIVNKDSIKVFGLPVVLKWKNIEVGYYHDLEFHFYSSFFADYMNNKELKKFLNNYQKFNYTQPYYHTRENYPYYLYKEGYNFAYLGYDITMYFLSALLKFGPDFEKKLDGQQISLLHSNFDFEKISDEGGYINKKVDILKYTHDYHLVKVK